jgi:hypothetical protein
VTPPPPPLDGCAGFGVVLGLGLAVAMVGTLATEDEGVDRACGLACAAGEEGAAVGLAEAVADDCAVAPGPAWKPRLDAEPLPGATSRNAATTTPARTSGPIPKSATLTSLFRRFRQAGVRPGVRPTDPADVADPFGVDGRLTRAELKAPRPRRAGVEGLAKGPAVGGPAGALGYQPTVGSATDSAPGSGGADSGGADSGGAGRSVAAGSGWLSGVAGGDAGDSGVGVDDAPKLGGIPPGLA